MLNEENDCTDNAAVGDDIYSVVTEENWSDPDDDIVELDGIVDDTEYSEHLGQLILEGEEYNGGDDEEEPVVVKVKAKKPTKKGVKKAKQTVFAKIETDTNPADNLFLDCTSELEEEVYDE